MFFVLLTVSAVVETTPSSPKGVCVGTCLCVLGREIKKLVPALSTELITGTVFACRVSHLFLVHCSYNNFLNSFLFGSILSCG